MSGEVDMLGTEAWGTWVRGTEGCLVWSRPREARGAHRGHIVKGLDRWVRGLGDIRRAGRALEVFRARLRAWRRALAFWLLS